jgi:hypothetical protein
MPRFCKLCGRPMEEHSREKAKVFRNRKERREGKRAVAVMEGALVCPTKSVNDPTTRQHRERVSPALAGKNRKDNTGE